MKSPKISGVAIVRGENGLVRIAHSMDIRKRMSEWQAASATSLKIVGLVRAENAPSFYDWTYCYAGNRTGWTNAPGIHRWLKIYFSTRCVNREWYALDDKVLASLPFERL